MFKTVFQNPWGLLQKQISAMKSTPSMYYSPGMNIKWLDSTNAFIVIEPLGWRIFIIDGQVFYLIQMNIPFFCGPSAEGYGKIDVETGNIEYNCLPKHKELERIANLQKGNIVFVELDKIKTFKKEVLNLDERFINSWYVVDFVNYASFYGIIELNNSIEQKKREQNIIESDHSISVGTNVLPFKPSLKRKFDLYIAKNKNEKRQRTDNTLSTKL